MLLFVSIYIIFKFYELFYIWCWVSIIKLRYIVSILNDYDVLVFVNKIRNGSKCILVKNKIKCI